MKNVRTSNTVNGTFTECSLKNNVLKLCPKSIVNKDNNEKGITLFIFETYTSF